MVRRPCIDCGRPTPGTRCPEHQAVIDRSDNHRRHRKAKANGLHSREWKQVRAARLAVDGYRCKLRRLGCTEQATTVHLDPACKGNHLLATLDNTRSACLHCHGVVDGGRSAVAA